MELVEVQFIFLCCIFVICVSVILGIIIVAILSSAGVIKSKEDKVVKKSSPVNQPVT